MMGTVGKKLRTMILANINCKCDILIKDKFTFYCLCVEQNTSNTKILTEGRILFQ